MRINEKQRRRRGFSLIEVVIAMALIAFLVGGIYAIARGAFRISRQVVDNQERSMTVYSFLELCRRNFESMPGNAKLELVTEGAGEQAVSELIFTEYPLAFSWDGVPAGSTEVIMMTEKESRGSLAVKLQYLNEDEVNDRRGALRTSDVGVVLPLLSNVKQLRWQFYDSRTEEWEAEWEDANLRPSLVELVLEFYDGLEPVRSVFWVPTMQNPEQVAQTSSRAAADQGGNNGGAAGSSRTPQLPSNRAGAERRLNDLQQRGRPGSSSQ